MKLIKREAFSICGYAVETNAQQNTDDLSALYKNFSSTGKKTILRKLQGSKKGFYGLMWYTQEHHKYCYLLGIEVNEKCKPPANSVLKAIPKTTYAVSCYADSKDTIEAWNELFFTVILSEGYIPNDPFNLYFEFHPENIDGNYELWVPVVKANV